MQKQHCRICMKIPEFKINFTVDMFYFTDDMFSSVLKQPKNYLNIKYRVSFQDFTLKWDQRYELPQSCSKRYEFSL